jgi:hypothetical protein
VPARAIGLRSAVPLPEKSASPHSSPLTCVHAVCACVGMCACVFVYVCQCLCGMHSNSNVTAENTHTHAHELTHRAIERNRQRPSPVTPTF